MGVMHCSRVGCDHIMCDNYSPKHGYLCNPCKTELKTKIGVSFKKFIQTPIEQNLYSTEEWEKKVDKEFTSRWDSEED